MLRNPLKNYKNNDIICQIIDWKSYDILDINKDEIDEEEGGYNDGEEKIKKQNQKLIIRGYGVTENGNSVCILIDDFKPFFYFEIPQDWDIKKLNQLKSKISYLIDRDDDTLIVKADIVKKKKFYGFTNNEIFYYGVFVFKNQTAYYSALRIMREKDIVFSRVRDEKYNFKKKLYETKVSSLLRFFHIRNIDPSGWIRIPANKFTANVPSQTRAQIDVTVHFNDIERMDVNNIAKIIVASFDLECTSEDGSFPKPDRKNDKIIQIGTTVYFFGDNECKYRYIATLNACDPIEDTTVESFNTEKDVILGWASFIERLDPDILTGYNIWGFDWEYIFKRAENGNGGVCRPYCKQLFKKLNRLKNKFYKKEELTIQDLSSSALGQNILKFIDIEGIVQIDLLKVVQRDHKLDSYKLDNVAKHFTKQQKVDLSPQELFKNFREGTPDKIKEIAVYCIMDCKLVNDLINRLQVITNNLGMSNVCVVPFSYLFLRGQGIKIFSLVAKFCKDENFLIKDLMPEDIDTNSYEGAIVFVPTPGIYFNPVVVMDYNSLYPSSMIAENISHDSIVGFKEYELIKNNYELKNNTINEKYDQLPGYNYIDIEYDIFQGVDDSKKKVGYKVCRFAENKNGDKAVLPRILKKLLKARKDTRKIMEYSTFTLNDGSIIEGIKNEDGDNYKIVHVINGTKIIPKNDVQLIKPTNNEFQLSVLDGLQLAYKVTCNSLYGQVGATTSPICYKELAACTTATGRKMVIVARDLTLDKFKGAKLTYGDSVTGDTPLLIMKNGFVDIVRIDSLNNDWVPYKEFKPFDTDRKDKEQTDGDSYLVWTSNGWSKIVRVIRHKTHKRLYRIQSELGAVTVTEDHSLLDINKNIVKPGELFNNNQIHDKELLYGFPDQFPNSCLYMEFAEYQIKEMVDDIINGMLCKIPYDILNNIESQRLLFVTTLYNSKFDTFNDDDLFYQSLYYLLKSLEKNNLELVKKCWAKFYNSVGINDWTNYIVKIDEYDYYDDYVYDIETETGDFQAGIGQLIVKNTDSIFVDFSDEIKNNNPGKELTEKDLLIESIKIGELAAANINSNMKAPQNIEYEKTFWPFCIFSKKRYFGNKYEHNPEKYKQTSMGIVLKRRDNAPIVKTIYGGVIDIILNQRDIEKSKQFFYDSIKNLLEGNVDIGELVISKTVKTDYANPNQIAHKVLADRIGMRDPGNKPQSNDRVPYCYIDVTNLKCVLCNKKVSENNCKCILCMELYCADHLKNHREKCVKICRFCHTSGNDLNMCYTCNGLYCVKCFEKHKTRKDKQNQVHYDKCKKPLSNKLLQGDMIEHPLYILEKNLKIDFDYYLSHQIQVPVYQIFQLVMKDPPSIIVELVRKMNNTKNGNHSIKAWLNLSSKKPEEEKVVKGDINKLKEAIKNMDEEDDLLKDQFDEIENDPDEINCNDIEL